MVVEAEESQHRQQPGDPGDKARGPGWYHFQSVQVRRQVKTTVPAPRPSGRRNSFLRRGESTFLFWLVYKQLTLLFMEFMC